MSDKLLVIGAITGGHGVKGEVKVFSLTDNKERFTILEDVYLTDKSGEILDKLTFKSVRFSGKMIILRFAEIADRDKASCLKGKYIGVKREDAVTLPENSYFVCDITGCEVMDSCGIVIGKIANVIATGANDVYVVERKEKKDLLVPALKSVIKEVDIEKKKVIVELPEGLEGIYD